MLSLLLKKDRLNLFFVFLCSLLLFLTSCAGHETIDTEVAAGEINEKNTDPFEGFNRKTYVFNEVLDDYVAEPISDAYLWVTPKFLQTGVSNFFNNLTDINVVLNDFMQGKVGQGGEDTGRFFVNSTFGVGGLFDVATRLGLEKHYEDFEQTLAVWGVPQGPYLVIPVLGPMTARGIPGGVFDTAANPTSYIGLPLQLLQMLNARANAEGALSFIDEAALDPYIFTREAFLQYRNNLITDGKSEINDDIFDLDDDFYEEEDGDVSVDLESSGNDVVKEVEVVKSSRPVLPQVRDADIDAQIREARLKLKLRSNGIDSLVME